MENHLVYLLACAKIEDKGGIYSYQLSNDGKFCPVKYYACDRPMFAVNANDKLSVILRAPFENLEPTSNHSGYFTIDYDLSTPSDLTDTLGVCACHLAVENEDSYIVNYLSGNIVKNCQKAVAHSGKGPHQKRQEAPHTHFVCFTEDKSKVLCNDLGIDTVLVYDRDLHLLSKATVPSGYGVRHLVISNNQKYVYTINELVPSISVFSFNGCSLILLSTLNLPFIVQNSTAAAIRLSNDGKFIYCSVRAENALYVLSVEGDTLKLIQKVDCGGMGPRDIYLIDDKFIISCNENSDNAVCFSLKENLIDKKTDEVNLKGVLCCLTK